MPVRLALLLLTACTSPAPDDSADTSDSEDSDTADSEDSDTADTDTADTDTGDTGDTADTNDTNDTGDTGDTADTGDTGGTIDTADTADTGDTEDTDLPGLGVQLVASGLSNPVDIVAPPGDPRLFIVEKRGTVRVVLADGTVSGTYFLDLTGQVDTGNSEQGLLGLAFHPEFASNHLAYVNYTDPAGDTVVAEYEVSGDVALTATKRVVLEVDQPYDNHNGGGLVFGPDGMLYIGLGDGGGTGDPDGRGQNVQQLLGKMLRIDPLGGDSDNDPAYGVPADNPYVGLPLVRPEIWAYGLRNPWRYSFDRLTGDLWIADVGQGEWEEIDFQPASSDGGENWGWDACEGTHRYPPVPQNNTCILEGALPPIHEYHHSAGCSVTGGFVYRGQAIPMLQGRYVYSDYCEAYIRSFERVGNTAGEVLDHTADLRDGARAFAWISTIGQDADGELYFAEHNRGNVWRIVPGP